MVHNIFVNIETAKIDSNHNSNFINVSLICYSLADPEKQVYCVINALFSLFFKF